jgi:SAM-dependent methyltransferase
VDSWHLLTIDSDAWLSRIGMPRRILSRLVKSARLGVGSSVLDVGCQRGELAHYLASLGIHCTGISESPQEITEAWRNSPRCEFHRATINKPLPIVDGEFDLILVRESSAFRTPMLSRRAFAHTLQLLPSLRPGGCLAFLTRHGDQESAVEGHEVSCYARHLALLPGAPEHQEISVGGRVIARLRSFIGRSQGARYGFALLRVPRKRLTQVEWALAVDAAARHGDVPCCPWAAELAEPAASRRRAA